ncbi:hypothetical protein BJY01DRAFT_239425 [Aspergillus pseudoustus]|uniref:DUF7924 domain-containing protein n=1 Tax=Aspergillus pseudoustus TaxID=1810923 RepID=A0ABR4J238_9EURO
MDQVKHLRRETTDETPARPSKTSAYTGQKCPLFLKARGSYLGPHKDGIAQEDQQMCVALLARECDTPRGMILDDATFPYLQHRILERNEKAVVILLGQALVPSAEIEKLRGNVVFDGFIDTINESWTGWVPLHADTEPATEKQRAQQQEQLPRPQPDYSVGFLHEAFGDARLRKLTPLLAGIGDNSLFKGTLEMLFPFLTAEAKSAKRTLLEASHQNAHSMTCALRGVVKLFQLVKREAELHRRILGFSCAYDHERVQWYGHYVAVREDDSKITYHRHEIETLSLKARNGRDRWASYKLALAVYNDWVPKHLERLCSAIDDLPDNISFDVDPDPTPQVAADGDGIVES